MVAETVMLNKRIPMPKVQPLPIETKGKGLLVAIWIWLTVPRSWLLLEDYELALPGIGKIFVPQGFIFDGASIPRIFWFFLSPVGLLFIPGLLHDYGYRKNELILRLADGTLVYKTSLSKKYWDKLFMLAAIHVNGFEIINKAAWLALQLGGHGTWKGHRKNDPKREEG